MSRNKSILEAVAHVFRAMGALATAVSHLVATVLGCPQQVARLKEGHFMIIVKNTQPDVRYACAFNVVDAEGSPVPDAKVAVEVVSDNPSAVEILPDADPRTGAAHFGSPNPDGSPATANITVNVKLPDGTLVGSFGEQFTVTAGDPTAIAAGTIGFEGLAPA